MSILLSRIWGQFVEYETPRLVKIHNKKVGLILRLIQLAVILYVSIFALWLEKGYQEFCSVESSVTTKIKGVSMSHIQENDSRHGIYSRVWDEADYVVPPAENGAFFVATNVIITPNQSRGRCPEDYHELPKFVCIPDPSECIFDYEDHGQWRHPRTLDQINILTNQNNSSAFHHEITTASSIQGTLKCKSKDCKLNKMQFKAHGPMTGYCVLNDRTNLNENIHVCEIESWCPIEIDQLPLSNELALMVDAKNYTVFIKSSVAFPYFGDQYTRNNLVGNNGKPCLFKQDNETGENNGCQIFKLGDIVKLAGGDFSRLAIKGGVVLVTIHWNCDLDWDFMKTCLPKYKFRILDEFGWNFREGKYHEENRRTLYKLYGLKFIVTVEGRGGKFDIKNTVLNIGSGLALLGLATIVCDFLLMHIEEKVVIKQKKYESVKCRRSVKKDRRVSTINIQSRQSVDHLEDSMSGVSNFGQHLSI